MDLVLKYLALVQEAIAEGESRVPHLSSKDHAYLLNWVQENLTMVRVMIEQVEMRRVFLPDPGEAYEDQTRSVAKDYSPS